ncbi:MAG: NAD(P)H-dependent oxidoreductase subunit E, partial [Actinobacteria bacterium]|nr:NAD(P)H-dependent oxidoreductase subunit E [Actinomycetota bacterium]
HGTACHVSGATLVSEEIEKHLGIHAGENTEDMLYTIEEVHCVGACGMAPVVMINDRAFGKLTPAKAVEVVKQFQARVEAEGNGGGPASGNGGGPASGNGGEAASADDATTENIPESETEGFAEAGDGTMDRGD